MFVRVRGGEPEQDYVIPGRAWVPAGSGKFRAIFSTARPANRLKTKIAQNHPILQLWGTVHPFSVVGSSPARTIGVAPLDFFMCFVLLLRFDIGQCFGEIPTTSELFYKWVSGLRLRELVCLEFNQAACLKTSLGKQIVGICSFSKILEIY